MATIYQDSDKTILVLQLERNRIVVEQLKQKLNSYRCAPCTHQLHEQKESLKTGLDRFANSIEELLATLRSNGIKVMNYIDDVQCRFEEFNALHQEVEAYVKTVRQ